MGDTILAAAVEMGINENWCFLENQLTCNASINRKYLSNIRDDSNGHYSWVHCNTRFTHNNIIGELYGYSYTVWYNPRVIYKILSLGLVQKNHIVN